MFVSTGGNSKLSAVDYANYLFENNFQNIELSGGNYDQNFVQKLLRLRKAGANLTLHNYIPFSQDCFVLNLASNNKTILKQSIEHVRQALYLSGEIGAKYYAVHGGFLVDPKVSELGRELNRQRLQDKYDAVERFKQTVSELSSFAGQCDVRLLIENNVITVGNLNAFERNPLLLCGADEMIPFFQEMKNFVSLLLDVGHLKVSSNTLGLDPIKELKALMPFIGGLHLSDNDGLADTNMPYSEKAWFMSNLPQHEYTVVEVYEDNLALLRKQLLMMRKSHDKNP